MLFYMNFHNNIYRNRQRSIYLRNERLDESESPDRYVFLYVPGPTSTRWTYSLSLSQALHICMKELKVKMVL